MSKKETDSNFSMFSKNEKHKLTSSYVKKHFSLHFIRTSHLASSSNSTS